MPTGQINLHDFMIFAAGKVCKAIHEIPCLSCLIIVISSILAQTESSLFLFLSLVVLTCVCLAKAWRLALLCLLLGICSWGITDSGLQHDEQCAALYGTPDGTLIETSGSVIRTFTRSVWLQCESPETTLEVIPPEGVAMHTGEKWSIRGLAAEIPSAKTPGAFDRKEWLSRNRVTARMTPIEMTRQGKGSTWSQLLATSESWRNQATKVLAQGGVQGDPSTGVITSLLLGEKKAMDTETLQIFRKGGCLHIFAVSGLHVGFAAGIFFFFFSFFRLSPITIRLLTLVPLSLYVFVTGMPVSAMRAFVMVCLFFIGTALRRKTHAVNLLAFTGIIFLIKEPLQLYDAGFLLSFLIFGVVVISGSWESRRPAWWAPDPFIPQRIYTWRERMGVKLELQTRTAVIISIICWLAAIPVTIGCFGTFNVYAAAVNIAIVPLVPVVMFSCMAGIMLFWCPPALLVCNELSRWLAGILLSISSIAADQPGALFYSTLPSRPGQAMLIPAFSKEATLICGNPATVINPGDANQVNFTISPAIRHQGFSPAIALNTQAFAKNTQGLDAFRKEFPHVATPMMPKESSLKIPLSGGGSITIFPPGRTLTTGIADDRRCAILWEYKAKRLLYADAISMQFMERIIRESGTIDILIVAFHAKDPATEADAFLATKAKHIIFQPDERYPSLPLLPKEIHQWNLRETGTLLLNMEEASVTPWNSENRTK